MPVPQRRQGLYISRLVFVRSIVVYCLVVFLKTNSDPLQSDLYAYSRMKAEAAVHQFFAVASIVLALAINSTNNSSQLYFQWNQCKLKNVK